MLWFTWRPPQHGVLSPTAAPSRGVPRDSVVARLLTSRGSPARVRTNARHTPSWWATMLRCRHLSETVLGHCHPKIPSRRPFDHTKHLFRSPPLARSRRLPAAFPPVAPNRRSPHEDLAPLPPRSYGPLPWNLLWRVPCRILLAPCSSENEPSETNPATTLTRCTK